MRRRNERATTSYPATITALSRLRQDLIRLKRDPVPYITAEPIQNQILEWHYVVEGPDDSHYSGGYYHGKLIFPKEYPFRPPAIYMLTPNGRFEVNRRLCLSISDFHPEQWNPSWSVSTILTGLLSFMLESSSTVGSIETTPHQKKCYARASLDFNLKNKQFCELFPDIVQKIKEKLMSSEQNNNSQVVLPGSVSGVPTFSWCSNILIVLSFAALLYFAKSISNIMM